ncbi:MAG TPA: chemotaxis protein CheB, partial [Syntrophorhabdales bacterium]|nr:chemotaxis protein CheB [Syntrophorhabdales bacterium]
MDSKKKKQAETTNRPFPVVGIGASAGGFEALEAFLAEMPEDFGFAIVFIQHLSPNHESLLPDLLRSRRSELDIDEISDGLELLPGKLYVCPPGKEVRIEKGSFHIAPRPEGHTHLPIDEFFTSLAGDIAGRAIAVILSGAGTDGASGIQAVRKAGGTVFVQDPATAGFPAMPLAAIDTEVMDAVLSPADIAREILKLHGSGAISAMDLVRAADFEAFYQAISERTGYRFNHYKRSVVARRIRRRMYLHGVSSVGAYLEMLAKNDSEAAALASDLMIGVTSFFRDKLSWKALHLDVTRKLALMEDDTPIRVWTPACATGEEAYSIAMMLQHELDIAGRKREIQVFATDVNDRALEKAREGTYPSSIASDMPPEYIAKFFTPSGDGLSLTISKEIRQHIVFAKQDLLTDPPFSRLDLVICRNLLIYLEPDAQEKCITLFHYALKTGGYLFLGNAESPGRGNTLFIALAHKKCRVYRAVEVKEPARMPLAVPFAAEHATPPPARQAGADFRQPLTEFIHQALLEEFAPASVVITQAFDIVFNNGPTHRYLRQPHGPPTQNLLDLLPKHLHNRVRAGLFRAAQEMKPVSIRTNMTDESGRKRQVAIRISKLRENLFLATFKEKGGLVEEAGFPEGSSVEATATRQLESELSATRETLQSNIEQLRSLNEEMQSSNEELQAANEELETSREELQSLNEELVAVNSQLQTKVEEQEETNNDLNNFLTSTSIPTIFLDYHFRVRRFTPAMSKLIKLIASDAGRPIIDMSRENLGPDLISDAQSVLDQLAPVKREFSVNGSWYVRTTLPYRTSSNRIEGVVVTYNDVTELKRAEERTKHLASFPQLNPNPVVELDSSGRITFLNPAGQKTLEDLDMRRDEARAFLPDNMDSILKDWDHTTQTVFNREVTIKDRVFGETISLIPQLDVARTYVFDITDRRAAEEQVRESRTRLEAALASMSDAVFIADAEGRFIHFNDAFVTYHRFRDREECSKKIEDCATYLDVYFADGTPAPPDMWAMPRALRGETASDVEYMLRRKDTGETWWGSYNFAPIKGRDGQMAGAVVVGREITDRKAAERKLQDAHRLLADVIDGSPSPIYLKDREGKFITINAPLEKMLGMTREELKGKTDYDIATKEMADYWRSHDKEVMRTGQALQIEEVADLKDGHHVFLASKFPLVDATGEIYGVGAISHDITRQKAAEEALRASEEHYRSLFENMLNGYAYCKMIFDESGPKDFTYLNVNAAFEALTGLKNVTGKNVSEVIPGIRQSDPELFEIYGRVALTGAPERFETYVEALGMWFSISVYSPQKEYFVAVFDVITERKRAEEALRRSRDELEERVIERTAEVEKERRRLYDVLETLPAMICLLTPDHHVTFTNRSFRAKFGEPKGRHCYEYCFGFPQPCDFCESYKVLETGKPHHWEVNTPDGHVIDAYDFPFAD